MTKRAEHVHLIGIGGTAMTALAGLLAESGCRVSGSDGPLYPPTSTILERLDVEVLEGYAAAHLDPAPDLVVVGNAVRRGNPEAEETLDRKLPYTSMAACIAERFLAGRHAIVVAGTHGKTTTTSMLAWVLASAGRDPGFLVGGLARNFERPFRIGAGPAFVIEGDEYDTAFFDKGPKFMHYRPDTALVGTVEFDHADIYRDEAQVRQVFERFTNIVPRRGLLVRHEECALTRDVTAAALSRLEGYGLADGTWRAVGLDEREDGTTFDVRREGREYLAGVHLALGGDYNVRNALAVIAACHEQGLDPGEIRAGLESFEGVARRLDVRGLADGVTVVDDFAHHPTAIAAVVQAARRRWSRGRLWAVLEPRSWSLRRNIFQERLATAFDAADEMLVAPVFRADAVDPAERLDTDALALAVRRRGTPARAVAGVAEIVRIVGAEARADDVVLIMSNGGFDGLHGRLLDNLRARTGLRQDAG